MEVSSQLHALTALALRRKDLVTLNKRLGGHQRLSGGGDEKEVSPLEEIEHAPSNP
jgi:hypothetical protein